VSGRVPPLMETLAFAPGMIRTLDGFAVRPPDEPPDDEGSSLDCLQPPIRINRMGRRKMIPWSFITYSGYSECTSPDGWLLSRMDRRCGRYFRSSIGLTPEKLPPCGPVFWIAVSR